MNDLLQPGSRAGEPEYWLLDLRGGRPVQAKTIRVCRRFAGTILLREPKRMLVEFSGPPRSLNFVVAQLPARAIDRILRSSLPDEATPRSVLCHRTPA